MNSLLSAPPPARPADAEAPRSGCLQVFEDPRSRALLAQVRALAASDAHALLLGESGTGKDMLAEQIHLGSARRGGPFLSVNCGAFPDAHVEGELFGYEKGAFPGAFSATVGWLESAQGGTLLLDEVDRLPPHLQVKLLRVIQDRQLVRLGGRRPIALQLRLIAATPVDLERAVRSGRFRDDLYHALRVAPLHVPPLRERPGDILPLARHFLAEYQQRMNFPPTRLSPEAEAKLLAHGWPGNLRELENVIHHALLLSREPIISGDLIALSGLQAGEAPTAPAPASPSALGQLDDALERLCQDGPAELYKLIERSAVRTAWRHCRHNQVKAAQLLGISRNVLRARLIEFGDIAAQK